MADFGAFWSVKPWNLPKVVPVRKWWKQQNNPSKGGSFCREGNSWHFDAREVAKTVKNSKLVVYLATYVGLNAPNCGASAWISRELTWPKLVPRCLKTGRLGEVNMYVDLWIKDPRNPTKIKLRCIGNVVCLGGSLPSRKLTYAARIENRPSRKERMVSLPPFFSGSPLVSGSIC